MEEACLGDGNGCEIITVHVPHRLAPGGNLFQSLFSSEGKSLSSVEVLQRSFAFRQVLYRIVDIFISFSVPQTVV